MRCTTRLAALVAACTLLPATAALAHPSLNPNEVPAGEPVETTVVVPHGCSTTDEVMPDEGESVPTTRFDLELVDGVAIDPGEVEGWQVEDDGEAIVWTDAGGATTDPIEFPVTITAEGDPGDELALSAFQECEDGQSHRWAEGSEDTPPITLELTEGSGSDPADPTEAGDPTEEATEPASETPSPTAEPTEEDTGEQPEQAAADADDDNSGIIAAIVAALIAIGAGGIIAARRRRGGA